MRKPKRGRTAAKDLTVSHRERIVEELRVDPELATEYLRAAAQDDDPRIRAAAARTVAIAEGVIDVARAPR